MSNQLPSMRVSVTVSARLLRPATAETHGAAVADSSRASLFSLAEAAGVLDRSQAMRDVVDAIRARARVQRATPRQTTDDQKVWNLVERAQAGDAEAFGLIYDK